jgi:hypothetical protein
MESQVPISGVRVSSSHSFKVGLRHQRSERGVIALESCGSSNLGSFKILLWVFGDKKPFGCGLRREAKSILYGGRWWLPPSPGHGESCESELACGSS